MSSKENLPAAQTQGGTTTLPLQGKYILVTRTSEQASALSERLRTLGAIPIEFPTIRILPPLDWGPLDNTLKKLCNVQPTEQVDNFLPDLYMNQEQSSQYSRGDPCGRPSSEIPCGHPSENLCSDQVVRPADGPSSNSGGRHKDGHRAYYDWLIFTSANGVNICFERMHILGLNTKNFSTIRIAAIGPATAAQLARNGVTANLVPTEYIAEGIAAALIEDARQRGESLAGKSILLARAAEARKVLATELQQAGAIVDEVAAYRTLGIADDDKQGQKVLRLLELHQLDILTFTSSSTVRNFMQWLKRSAAGSSKKLVTQNKQLKVACIGPITSQTARELGLDVHIQAKEFTIDGLVKAIIEYEEKS